MSAASLRAIFLVLQECQPILGDMDIPSESYLKNLKLAVNDLNSLQIENYVASHRSFTFCFDETPTRYSKAVACGLYSRDGDFLCIGIEPVSGNNAEHLLEDIKKIINRIGHTILLGKIDSIIR